MLETRLEIRDAANTINSSKQLSCAPSVPNFVSTIPAVAPGIITTPNLHYYAEKFNPSLGAGVLRRSREGIYGIDGPCASPAATSDGPRTCLVMTGVSGEEDGICPMDERLGVTSTRALSLISATRRWR